VDYALSRPDVDRRRLRVAGQGAGALWVLFAAALDQRITDVIAQRGLVSYRSLARVDRYIHSAGIFVPDILKHFDLPQLTAALAGRRVTLAGPVDAMKRSVPLDAVRREYAIAESAFATRGDGAFKIVQSSDALLEAS
jgi:hypothetical protein